MFIGIYKKRTTLLTMFDFWLFLSWLSIYSGTRLIGTCTGHTIVSILSRCLYSAGLQKNATDTCLINIKTNADNFIRKHCLISHTVMYRSNRSFNMPPPPRQPPGHLTFLKIIVQIPPYPGQNAVQMPHTRIHSGDQMPPPRGHFTGMKMTERRWKRLQLSNKIFL